MKQQLKSIYAARVLQVAYSFFLQQFYPRYFNKILSYLWVFGSCGGCSGHPPTATIIHEGGEFL